MYPELTMEACGQLNHDVELNQDKIPNPDECITQPDMYMLCISKTACFSVNCIPLSLQFGQNDEPKGSNGSRPWECDYRTPPSKSDMAPFWRAKPQPIRGFPAIEPVTFQHR